MSETDLFNDQSVDGGRVETKPKSATAAPLSFVDEIKQQQQQTSLPKIEKESEKEKKLNSLFDSDASMDDIFKIKKSSLKFMFKVTKKIELYFLLISIEPVSSQPTSTNRVLENFLDDEDIFSDSNLLNKDSKPTSTNTSSKTESKSNVFF